MGWRRGLIRNKIWSFDVLHSLKQAYRCPNGKCIVLSACRKWNSFAVNEVSWIFYCFFGRTTPALHDFNKLALASILAGCDGRRSFMRMSPDPCKLNRRLQLWAFSGTHLGKDWAFWDSASCLRFWCFKQRWVALAFSLRVNNKQTGCCCRHGYLDYATTFSTCVSKNEVRLLIDVLKYMEHFNYTCIRRRICRCFIH